MTQYYTTKDLNDKLTVGFAATAFMLTLGAILLAGVYLFGDDKDPSYMMGVFVVGTANLAFGAILFIVTMFILVTSYEEGNIWDIG